jgi:ABC-type glycerol-3-phosphate transport system substrate-binding protein
MKKRPALLLWLVLLGAPLLFGAGGQEKAAPTTNAAAVPKTVSWLHIWGAGTEKEQIAKSIELFQKANPDVKVEEIIMDASTWQPKLIQMLSGDTPPDIFLWYPGPKTNDLVDQGVIGSMSEMWAKNNLDDLIPAGLKNAVTYKGQIVNLPWGFHPTIVFYNKKMFGSLGLTAPEKIAEFEAIADKIKATGVYPLSSGDTGLSRASYAIELLIPSLAGPDFYRDMTTMDADWGDARARAAYEYWKRWVDKKYWYPDMRSRRWADGLTILINKEAGMYFLGTYGSPMLKQAGWKPGEDFDAFLFPQENSQFPRTFTGPFDTWCTAAKAPHPAEASRLLAFLATKEPQTMRAVYHGGMACNRFVTEYDSIGMMAQDALKAGAVFYQVMGSAMPPSTVPAINRGAVPDFYDNPDIEAFIKKCEAARDEYLMEKKK